MPRYLVVTRACYLSKTWARTGHEPIEGRMILVEEDDGTLRRAQGADLVDIDRQYPGFLGAPHLTDQD